MSKLTVKRIVSVGLAATLSSLALAACAGSGGDANTAKVGVFLPLTGENAENGKQIKQAAEQYVEEYNSGDHQFDIELVVRDDRGEPKTATNIAREFAQDQDMVAAVGSFSSTGSMAAAPILDAEMMPLISPTSSHPDFTDLGEYVFRGTPTQSLEASQIAEHMQTELGAKKAAVIYRQDDWGNSAAEAFVQGFEEQGGEVVASEAVVPDMRDFRTLVTSLKGKGVDSIYVALHYSDAAVLAQQMKASGWSPVVVTATSLYTHELVELSGGGPVEGWHVPAFFFVEADDPKIKDFVTKYEEDFGEKPNAFGGVGYDSMSVIGEALDQIDEVGYNGREALGEKMKESDFDGVTGRMKFTEDGDVQKEITWLQIKNGEFISE